MNKLEVYTYVQTLIPI